MARILTRAAARKATQEGHLVLVHDFLGVKFLPGTCTLLVADIENSVARRGDKRLGDEALEKFREAKKCGVRYVVLRTNKQQKERLGELHYKVSGDFSEMVAQLKSIGFDIVLLRQPQKVFWPPWAAGKWPRKPWRATFQSDRSAMQRAILQGGKVEAIKPSEILAIGDKFRFDVLRPLLMGWNVVLVNPLGSDGKGDRVVQIRRFERFTLWRLGLKRPR